MCSPASGTRGALLPSPSLQGVREFSERPHDDLRGRTERVEEATGAVSTHAARIPAASAPISSNGFEETSRTSSIGRSSRFATCRQALGEGLYAFTSSTLT